MKFICNTPLAELEGDKEKKLDQPLIFGGIVLDYEVRLTKAGKQYGKITMEDKSGTYELALFGRDYVEYGKFGIKGEFLMIKASYQRSKFDNSRIMLVIGSIEMLQDVKGKLIHNIEIEINPDEINASKSKVLASFLTSSTENQSELVFLITDPASGEKVQLMSDARISVTKQLLEYLDENGWNYRVEGRENPDKKQIETDAEIEEVDTFSLVNDD